MSAVPVSCPWRRYVRFSVRGMIVVILVIGIWMGWIVRSARIQREAVSAIKRNGGSVLYSSGWTGDPTLGIDGLRVPNWLVHAIGADYFDHACSVGFAKELSDKEFAPVGNLSTLESMVLFHTNLTDAGLAHLEGLTNLSELRIYGGAQVTDASCVHLKGLTKLSNLALSESQVSDAGMAQLKGLTKLLRLDLRHTHVSDAGLAHLTGFVSLSNLELDGTQVSDAGLAHVKGMTNLQWLGLSDTQVTDAGLAQLKGLIDLSSLDLHRTLVTDAGLVHLTSLTNLKSLNLEDTQVAGCGIL